MSGARSDEMVSLVGEVPEAFKILLVDDDPMTRKLYRVALERRGYPVVEAARAAAAEAIALTEDVALVVTDLRLPDRSGLELAAALQRARGDGLHRIALSGMRAALRASPRGLFHERLVKPVLPSALLSIVERYVGPPPERPAQPPRPAPRRRPGRGDAESQLAALAGVSELMEYDAPAGRVLEEALHRYLDAGVVVAGAVFLSAEEGAPRLRCQAGWPDSHLLWLRRFFDRGDLLVSALCAEDLIELSPERTPELEPLLEQIGSAQLLLVPLRVEGRPRGVLALAGGDRGARAFAWAIQSQLSLILGLGEARAAARAAARRLRALTAQLPYGVLESVDGRVVSVNPAAAVALGWPAEWMLGQETRALLGAEPGAPTPAEVRIGVGAGERVVQVRSDRFTDEQGRAQETLLLWDVTAQRRLSEAATRDRLTGLLNRRALLSDGRRMLYERSLAGQVTAALFMDLDDLKAVNDAAGHRAGDALIQRAAAAVSARLRETDLLARYGGDEFVALLPGVTSERAARIAASIQERVEALERPDGAPGRCGISVGWACAPEDGEALEALIERADQRMYAAKRRRKAGRGARSGGAVG